MRLIRITDRRRLHPRREASCSKMVVSVECYSVVELETGRSDRLDDVDSHTTDIHVLLTALSTSSRVKSSAPPTAPASFQNLLRCLDPGSHSTVTILRSFPIRNASLHAATQFTALDEPTKIPSFSTSHLAMAIACSSVTLIASSISSLPASKFAVTLLIPTPSTIVST